MSRVQLWSCGGGRQSAGIAALIVQGRLPKPDHVVMAALEWELRSTWDYVCGYIRPAMRSLNIPFTIVPRKKYATVDFWSGQDGQSTVLPVYSNLSGKASKLHEYCSGEWKREVVSRWAAWHGCGWSIECGGVLCPGWKTRGIDNWIGISWDERHRRRSARRKWIQPVYPLLDMLPKCVGVNACLDAVREIGWPEPPRSRCDHCPNQSDAEWMELTPAQLAKVCDREDEIRKVDPHAFFHKQLIPLRQVVFNPKEDNGGMFGGCTSGMCY